MKFNNRNIVISESAKIGANVKIGDNTVIYDNVVIEDKTIICNDCVIGEPLNEYYSDSQYKNPPTTIGKNTLIRSHTIVYAGCSLGESLQTGHRVTIRENMTVGNHCSIGTMSDLQGESKIGNYCRLHSSVHIGQNSTVNDFVFIYPFVVLANDPAPPSNILKGPSIGEFSQISIGSVLLPASEIGRHCLVGAHSRVNGAIEDFSLIMGDPAKRIKDIRNLKSQTNDEYHYPWPYHFSRGMPWEKMGFAQWKNENGFEND